MDWHKKALKSLTDTKSFQAEVAEYVLRVSRLLQMPVSHRGPVLFPPHRKQPRYRSNFVVADAHLFPLAHATAPSRVLGRLGALNERAPIVASHVLNGTLYRVVLPGRRTAKATIAPDGQPIVCTIEVVGETSVSLSVGLGATARQTPFVIDQIALYPTFGRNGLFSERQSSHNPNTDVGALELFSQDVSARLKHRYWRLLALEEELSEPIINAITEMFMDDIEVPSLSTSEVEADLVDAETTAIQDLRTADDVSLTEAVRRVCGPRLRENCTHDGDLDEARYYDRLNTRLKSHARLMRKSMGVLPDPITHLLSAALDRHLLRTVVMEALMDMRANARLMVSIKNQGEHQDIIERFTPRE